MMRLGSLCSGYGGLDLAVESVLNTEVKWVCEYDRSPSAVLARRFPGVPNLHDLTILDWQQVPPVDVLTAGYPCQPFSHAGHRKGTDDERHLWPYIAECIRVLRPRLVVLENVAGHLDLGFDTVLGDLASLGFDAEWCVVRASDVGACHQRARLFIAAWDTQGHDEWYGGEPRSRGAGGAQEPARGAGGVTANTSGDEPKRRRGVRDVGGPPSADEGEARERQRVRNAAGDRRQVAGEGGEWPDRTVAEYHRWRDINPDLEDADGFLWPYGHIEDWAAPADANLRGRDGREPAPGRRQGRRAPAARSGQDLPADASGDGLDWGSELDGTPAGGLDGAPGRHAHRRRLEAARGTGVGADEPSWGTYEPAIRRHERALGRSAPAPVDAKGRLAPQFVEWMMMLPEGWVTDLLLLDTDPRPDRLSRTQALKCLGNGVVPPQAAYAVSGLLARLSERQAA